MSYTTIKEITQEEIKKNSIAGLRSTPNRGGSYGMDGLSAQQLQERFDALPKLIANKLNEVITLTGKLLDNDIPALDSIRNALKNDIFAYGVNVDYKGMKTLPDALSEIGKEIADEAEARQTGLDGKIDKVNVSSGEKIYGAKSTGQVTFDLATSTYGYSVAQRKSTGALEVGEALDNADAVPLSQLRTLLQELKDALLGGASGAYDTLLELEQALTDDKSGTAALLAKISEAEKAISTAEKDLGGKVDTKDVSTKATPSTIAKRGESGRLAVGRASARDDAVPYYQMREELERYLADGGAIPPDLLDGITNAIKAIDSLTAKVANLEAGIAPDMFIVDDATAYVKDIPTDAKPYAQVLAVGGMTHKVTTLLGENLYDVSKLDSEMFNYRYEFSPNGSITVYNVYSPNTLKFSDIFPNAVVGKTYVFSYKLPYGGDWADGSIYFSEDVPVGTPFTLTEVQYTTYVHFELNLFDNGEAGMYDTTEFTDISLVEVTSTLLDTPVTALDITGKNLFDEKAITGTMNAVGTSEDAATITDEYVSVKIGSYMSSIFLTPFVFFLQEGQAVSISADVFIPTGRAPTLNVSLGIGNPLENIAKSVRYPILSSYDNWQRASGVVNAKQTGWHFLLLQGYGNASNFRNLDVRFKNIKVTTDTTDTTFSPYHKTTFAIPAAVQALEGYGKTGYGIEWDEQGKPWWVTPDARTDISFYFTEDNLIPVEGGGTITAVNAEGLAAPTTIVYQKRGV